MQDVRKFLDQVQGGIKESLKNANDELSKISNSKTQLDERETEISK